MDGFGRRQFLKSLATGALATFTITNRRDAVFGNAPPAESPAAIRTLMGRFPGAFQELAIFQALSTSKELNAVLGGGGARGLAFIGALRKAEELGVKFRGLGGVSAGALVASLYAVGYTANELENIALKTNFSTFKDGKNPVRLFKYWGIHPGEKLVNWLDDLFAKKMKTRFSDLDKEEDLRILAADVASQEPRVYDKSQASDLPISTAVRMSVGTPLFFDPIKQPLKQPPEMLVDGGVISTLPTWLFPDPTPPTIGLRLVRSRYESTEPTDLTDYLRAVAETALDGRASADEMLLLRGRVIHIDTGDISSYDYALTEDQKRSLMKSGYQAATKFFDRYSG